MVVEYNTCILNLSEKNNMCEQQPLKELSDFIDSNPSFSENWSEQCP